MWRQCLQWGWVAVLLIALAGCGGGSSGGGGGGSGSGGTAGTCNLTELIAAFVDSGAGSDTFTINGTARTDSADCDPAAFAMVNPDTQDMHINLLWGWNATAKDWDNQVFLSLLGRSAGLTAGPKDIVDFDTKAGAVNEFSYTTPGGKCDADVSAGPIAGGVNFSALGAAGGLVAATFSAVPMVADGPGTCSPLTGSFSVTREADQPDSGTGDVANPVALTLGPAAVAGTLGDVSGLGDGMAFYKFTAVVAGDYSIVLTNTTVPTNVRVWSSADFIGQLSTAGNCNNSTTGAGPAVCSASNLTAATAYYVTVHNEGDTGGTFNIAVAPGSSSSPPPPVYTASDNVAELTAAPNFSTPTVTGAGTLSVIVPVDNDTQVIAILVGWYDTVGDAFQLEGSGSTVVTKGAAPTATVSVTWSGTPPARSDYLVEVMLCSTGSTCDISKTGTWYLYIPSVSTTKYVRVPMPSLSPATDSGITFNHLTVQ